MKVVLVKQLSGSIKMFGVWQSHIEAPSTDHSERILSYEVDWKELNLYSIHYAGNYQTLLLSFKSRQHYWGKVPVNVYIHGISSHYGGQFRLSCFHSVFIWLHCSLTNVCSCTYEIKKLIFVSVHIQIIFGYVSSM